MKMTNYLLAILTIVSFMISCQNETSRTQDVVINDGTYCFVEINDDKDDDLFLNEFILIIKGGEVTGKSITWFEEGDHEFLSLESLTMSEVDLRGTISGTNLTIQEKEAEYGADHPNNHVLGFGEPETWSWENNQLMHSKKAMIMKKVHKKELKSSTYKKFDNAKITH